MSRPRHRPIIIVSAGLLALGGVLLYVFPRRPPAEAPAVQAISPPERPRPVPPGLAAAFEELGRLRAAGSSGELARRYPAFSYLPALREPPAAWRGERGEPAEVVDRLVHSVDRLIVYVCGGGDTIGRVRQALVAKGMDRKSVKWEKFW